MRHRQAGFNLIELMIAMTIGLLLTVTITGMFVDTKVSANRSATVSTLQQQAQLALQVLVDDVRGIGSWGPFSGEPSTSISTLGLGKIGGCGIGPASGAITTNVPADANWVSSNGAMGDCNDATNDYSFATQSNALSIARVQGNIVTTTTAAAGLEAGNYYIAASPQAAVLVKGSNTSAINAIQNGEVFPYLRRAYFVEVHDLDERTRLSRVGLVGDELINDLIVANIERFHIEFGVDNNSDGQADGYLNAAAITNAQWQNNRIVSARIYVLARADSPDLSYQNNNVYPLDSDGNAANDFTPADNYRRLLLSTTVIIKNNAMVGS